ncbi:putative ribonuclease H-like domain, reverse transcriptase zinc-binding domain-containing protein [Rosa chinensis]|uniref:Putative ribonuclease H-like domain, reverse transcriptase zinc-binding domain-containing protein n=1 Tax=Rosa chinensis TaxID=74649 RepID=A0A2P6QX62_ROSCH|nr:putative ribonuclease H-like domain, reverse transcriptase zinc-binding domain-containing protein [Rosa chinensis]
MSVFQLTKNFCDDLEQMCARFWWGSMLDKRKIHWKTWNALCNPKEEGGLGFRSLSNFNSAMLAKQAWRVVNNPSSIIARIYRAKYFPRGSFWTAGSHPSPSFSWRSIFSTRELLKEGSYWQVGSGTSINIWSASWVSALPDGKPIRNRLAEEEVTMVSDLLSATGVWDVSRIQRLFPMEEAEAILHIPLSSRLVADRLIWKFERNGVFSVRTAYQYSFSTSPCRRPFDLMVNGGFWKKLWKVLIPNAAKIFIWRICHNILPSLERLASKSVELESQVCKLCGQGVETTLHICRDCPFTQEVLQQDGILGQVCFHPQSDNFSLFIWLSYCASNLSLGDLGELFCRLWSIWRERNSRVWEDKTSLACDVIIRSISRIQEFRFHNSKPSHSSPRRGRGAQWVAPPVGLCKINIDGSFFHETRDGGFGFVVRDSDGTMLGGGAGSLRGLLSAEHAEVQACMHAVRFIAEHGFTPAILETDAMELQRQLNSLSTTNTFVLGRLYDDLNLMLEDLGNVRVVHVNRRANMVAHLMAAHGNALVQDSFYFSTPSFFMAAVAADLSSL